MMTARTLMAHSSFPNMKISYWPSACAGECECDQEYVGGLSTRHAPLPSSSTLSPCTQPDTRRRRAAKPLTSEAWLPLLLVCYSFRCYTVSHNRHTRLGEKALYVKDFSDDVLKEIRRFLESMNPDPL